MPLEDMTNPPAELVQEPPALTLPPEAEENPRKKVWKAFKTRIEDCKQYKDKLIPAWTTNIDYRRGKPFASQSDEDRIVVNLDWSMTKAKQSALFSQIPQVHINNNVHTQNASWLAGFEQKLNDTLRASGVESAMDEVLPDCINATGFGVVMCFYEELVDDVEVPTIDLSTFPPEVAKQIEATKMMPDGTPVPTMTVPRVADKRYVVQRISPTDFLWPINFTGADFDNAPWKGRTGRTTWERAKTLFNLTDEDKETVKGGNEQTINDRLTQDMDKDRPNPDDEVSFDEIFYKTFTYEEGVKTFSGIRHMVFVHGKKDPVIDEPWKGQTLDEESGELVGAMKDPIRVLTLTYISDESIPPSDSAISRPQVDEINRARTQMILQRERSLPIRWFDTNRVDPVIQIALMRGTWQGMVPVQGMGENIIGQSGTAAFPREDFEFYRIAQQDVSDSWQMSQNQLGNFSSGRRSASEASIIQSNFSSRIGRERAKVAKFFTSIAEVVGGLLSIFEPRESFGQGFTPKVSKALSYSILVDSTVLLDSNQKLQRLNQFLNMTVKSGWVNVEPIIKEIASLSGLDPNVVVQPPQPKPPVEPSISLRLTGVEDLLNPLTLAFLMKSGQAPNPELIEQAKQLIISAVTPPPGVTMPTFGPPQGPDPNNPEGGAMPPPAAPGTILPGSVHTPQPRPVQPPAPAPPAPGEANPDWGAGPRINKRVEDIGE